MQQSKRQRPPPSYYGEWVTVANNRMKEPAPLKEALASPDKEKWLNSMEKEMTADISPKDCLVTVWRNCERRLVLNLCQDRLSASENEC